MPRGHLTGRDSAESRRLVIFGSLTDPHVTSVADSLVQYGARVLFFDPAHASRTSHRICTPARPPVLSALDYASREAVDTDLQGSVVWLRRKWRKYPINSIEDQHRYHRLSELEGFFYSGLADWSVEHFNSLSAVGAFSLKPIQLVLAGRVGFHVPATLVSNEKEEILAFLGEHDDDCIMKPLSRSFIPPAADGSREGIALRTRQVSRADIENAEDDEVSWAPSIYQERIEKEYELRVVATQSGCIAYKIDSQNSMMGKLDWRHAQFERIYSPTPLEELQENKFVEFLRKAGLEYGVFDAIVATDGELIFVECNPDGQWAWLEHFCQTDDIRTLIADSVLGILRRGCRTAGPELEDVRYGRA